MCFRDRTIETIYRPAVGPERINMRQREATKHECDSSLYVHERRIIGDIIFRWQDSEV